MGRCRRGTVSKGREPDDEVGQQRVERGGLVGLASRRCRAGRGERGLVDIWIKRRGCVEGIGVISMSECQHGWGRGTASQGTPGDHRPGHHRLEGLP